MKGLDVDGTKATAEKIESAVRVVVDNIKDFPTAGQERVLGQLSFSLGQLANILLQLKDQGFEGEFNKAGAVGGGF